MSKVRVLGAYIGGTTLHVLGARVSAAAPSTKLRVLGARASSAVGTTKLRVLNARGLSQGVSNAVRVNGVYAYAVFQPLVGITSSATGTLEPGQAVTLKTDATTPSWSILEGGGSITASGDTATVIPGPNMGSTAVVTTIVQVVDDATGNTGSIGLVCWPVARYVLTEHGVEPVYDYVFGS